MEYIFHPLAEMFPSMSDEDLGELAKDIKQNGQLHPIQVIGDQIIDGCNRYRACKLLDVEPVIKQYEGDTDEEVLIRFVMSCNISRRQLTSGQKAMLANQLLPRLEALAKERQRASGGDRKSEEYQISVVQQSSQPISPAPPDDDLINQDEVALGISSRSVEQAAKMAGTNKRYVAWGKELNEKSPGLAALVKSGQMSIQAAKKELDEETGRDEEGEEKVPTQLTITFPKKGSSLQQLVELFDKMQEDPSMPEEVPVLFVPGKSLAYELQGVEA